MNGHIVTPAADVASGDATAAPVGPVIPESTEPTDEINTLAAAILRTFDTPGRGHSGNRCLFESEDQLRQYLTEDGVSFDDSTLSAALTLLETATLPASSARLVRGRELHRRSSSPHLPAAQLPSRARLLEHMHPFDYKIYESADIEPYLI